MAFFSTERSDNTGMHIFGQIGFCPTLRAKPKLYAKGRLIRYLHRVPPDKVLVELENGKSDTIRSSDFHAYYPFRDPKTTTTALFHTSTISRFPESNYRKGYCAVIEGPNSRKTKVNRAMVESKYMPRPIPVTITSTTPPPRNIKEAMRYPDTEEWKKSMDLELDKLEQRGSI